MFYAAFPEFIEPEKCFPNSLDFNPVKIVSSIAMDNKSSQLSDIDWLKCVLINCWTQAEQAESNN